MKKIFFCSMLLFFALELTSCGKVEENKMDITSASLEKIEKDEEEKAIEDNVKENEEESSNQYSNWLEESCKRTEFDTKEDLIANLESGNGYALVAVNGSDSPAVMITSMTYSENGVNASIMAYLYVKNEADKYVYGEMLASDSTATPLVIGNEECIYVASHNSVEKYALTSADNKSTVITAESYYVEYDESDESIYRGFTTDNHSSNEKDISVDGEEAKDAYDKLYKEMAGGETVNFIVVE